MASKITLAQLERHGACSEYRGRFEETFGLSAKVTLELALKHADRFDWSWAADNLLTSANSRTYYQALNGPDGPQDKHRLAVEKARRVHDDAFTAASKTWQATVANLPKRDLDTPEPAEHKAAREALCAAENEASQAYDAAASKARLAFYEGAATEFVKLYLTQPAVPERDGYLDKLAALDNYDLADMVSVSTPDASYSPGAEFLNGIRDDVHERLVNGATADDLRNESGTIASEFVEIIESRGTHRKWTAFVDLGAWQEDLSELGSFEDADAMANKALWQIADRFCHRVADQLDELPSEDDDDNATEPVNDQPYADQETGTRELAVQAEQRDTCDNCGVHGVFDDEDTCENCGHVR